MAKTAAATPSVAPSVSLSQSAGGVAHAAGDEGLVELVGHGVKTGEGDGDERELSPSQRGPGALRGENEQHTEYQVLGEMGCYVHDVGIGTEDGSDETHKPTLDCGQQTGAVENRCRYGRT